MFNIPYNKLRAKVRKKHGGSKFFTFHFSLFTFFSNFGFAELTMHSEMKRKTCFSFAFLSFFRNFAR